MRKPLVPAFSTRALKEQENLIRGYVDLLLRQLARRVESGDSVVDMKDYYNWTTFDIIVRCPLFEPLGNWLTMMLGRSRIRGAIRLP